ncbi:hypothetical protein VTL71DRAFT_8081, partial [Oculimacula yallundae]
MFYWYCNNISHYLTYVGTYEIGNIRCLPSFFADLLSYTSSTERALYGAETRAWILEQITAINEPSDSEEFPQTHEAVVELPYKRFRYSVLSAENNYPFTSESTERVPKHSTTTTLSIEVVVRRI